ncbi:MAG: ankyrin repeat domain-containing protein [Gemmatimonadales bacterium]|jgi:ankyrin repeat protein|nr:MAG: ankyrin repeat domain-containing protein [Gemmatimonadales bacterium]
MTRPSRRRLNGIALFFPILALLLLGSGPDAPVADAAARGDLDTVVSLLAAGADVNASQGDGMTGLHWAARHGEAAIAEALLAAGARTEVSTRLGAYRPLHLAAEAARAEVVLSLLSAGADPNALTSTGVAPIHFAAAAGNPEVVLALLEAGADRDVRDAASQRTPLMFAAARNRGAVLELLLARGADVMAQSRVVDFAERGQIDDGLQRERTERMREVREAQLRAAGNWREDQEGPAKLVVDPDDPDIQVVVPDDSEAKSEEEGEAEEGPSQAEGEEEEEARPMGYDDLVGRQGGVSALHLAAREGHAGVALRLLEGGADLDQPTGGDRSTPTLVAIINGHYDLAVEFLRRGADPNLASEDGVSPLYAVLNNRWAPKALYPQPTAFKQQRTSYLDLMAALLEAGADPNARVAQHIWYTSFNFDLLGVDFSGATPFWRAAYATDVQAMQLLVEYGADPGLPTAVVPSRRRRGGGDDQDPSGLPPAEVGGPAVYPIHAASGVGYGVARAGNSHRHAPGGWLPAVRYLVEHLGADVNQRDHDGYSPVHHAAARGDNELIRYLVEKGADVTFVSRRGQTTVDMANGPQQRVQPFPETIALLEGLGAKNNHNCLSC